MRALMDAMAEDDAQDLTAAPDSMEEEPNSPEAILDEADEAQSAEEDVETSEEK